VLGGYFISETAVAYCILEGSVCGEEMTADVNATKEWHNEELKDVLRGYLPENIYNADITTFFFNQMLPNKTMAYIGEKCAVGIILLSSTFLQFKIFCSIC
jgi:hypothetical protein